MTSTRFKLTFALAVGVIAVTTITATASVNKWAKSPADNDIKIELIGSTSTAPTQNNIQSWTLDLWSPTGKLIKDFKLEDGIYNTMITAKGNANARYLVFAISSPTSFEPIEVLEYVPEGIKVFGMTKADHSSYCNNIVGNFQLDKPKYYVAQMITTDKSPTYRLGYSKGPWTTANVFTDLPKTSDKTWTAKGKWGQIRLVPTKRTIEDKTYVYAYFQFDGIHPDKEQLRFTVLTTDGRTFQGYGNGRYEPVSGAEYIAPKLSEVKSVTVYTRAYKFVEFKDIHLK